MDFKDKELLNRQTWENWLHGTAQAQTDERLIAKAGENEDIIWAVWNSEQGEDSDNKRRETFK